MTAKFSTNHLNSECQNCQMHIVHSTGSLECLMEVIRSQWVRPFGDTHFCEHPDARQFVNLVNLVNSSTVQPAVVLRDTSMAA